MKGKYIKITGLFVATIIFGVLCSNYQQSRDYLHNEPVAAAEEEEIGEATTQAAVTTQTAVTTDTAITTNPAITTPSVVATPSVIVMVEGCEETYRLDNFEEALNWGNQLDVAAQITPAGEERELVLSQEIKSNVTLIVPESYQVKVVTGQAVTMSGILCNQGSFISEGKVVNAGTMQNKGRWENLTQSVNKGQIENEGIIENEDVLINTGEIFNYGTIRGGMITEDGTYEGNLAEITDMKADVYNAVYDGSGHNMVLSVTVQEGDKIEYGTDGVDFGENIPQITYVNEAGTVYVRVLRGSIYQWNSGQLKAKVRQAFPFYTVPEITAVHGQTLADIADYLPPGMVFEQSLDTSVGIVGNHTFRATYTPEDIVNYAKVIGIKVNVNVVKSARQLKQDKIMLPRTIIKKGKLVYSVTKGIVGNCKVKVIKAKSKKYKKIAIPDTIKYNGITYKVTKLENRAFEKNKKLKKIIIGKNVKTIGNRVFANDRKLSYIKVKSAKLKKVGKKATRHLSSHTKIYLPKASYTKYRRLILKGRKVSNIKFYKY